jgi:hypothetical protein
MTMPPFFPRLDLAGLNCCLIYSSIKDV